MEEYSVLVSGLEFKVRKLIEMKKSNFLKVQEMKGQIESLQNETQLLKKQLEEITKQKNILEISSSVEFAKDSKKIKLLINDYLREIDKCIAYLST